MAAKLVNQGEDLMLKAFVNHTAPQNLVLKLFKNDWTPTDADDEGDATEADFTGYSAKTLTGASWSATPGNPSSIAYAAQDFASSADQTPQTVYGAYLVQATSGKLVAAVRFANAVVFQSNGDTYSIIPTITLADSTD